MRETKTALARQVMELSRWLNHVTSEVVPVTIESDMQAGHTLMVRVPRLFIPGDQGSRI